MKHLFYFKNGDKVPRWLYSVTVAGEFVEADFKFCTNGKVLCDDISGNCYVWPAKKRFQYIAKINDISNANISGSGECRSGSCGTYTFFTTGRKSFGKILAGTVRIKLDMSPLTVARMCGHDIRTSTKCERIPPHFDRIRSGSPAHGGAV